MKKYTLTIILGSLLLPLSLMATTVRLETNVGNIDIELFDEQAPVTVQNFLSYVNDGDYDGTVVHRSVPGFIIQGGGYRYSGNGVFSNVSTHSPIVLEAGVSNTKGTIAMARTNNPDSATNQWFFNLVDNPGLDNNSTGGYAVFGKISRGLDVVELISSMQVVDFGEGESNLPQQSLINFPTYLFAGETFSNSNQGLNNYVLNKSEVDVDNVIRINKAFVLSDKFQINAGLSGAWFNLTTNGQGFYLEVLPESKVIISAWFTYDLLLPDASVEAEIGAPEHRWLTMQGEYNEDTLESILVLTEGGMFDSSEPVENSLFGNVQIVFDSCNRATLNYEITEPALTGSIPLQRQSDENLALCQQLSAEANEGVTP